MKTTLLSSIVLALCALGTLGAPVKEPTSDSIQPDGGFASSCTGTSVTSSGVLTSTCGNGSGGTTVTAIGLNGCIANASGALVPRTGGGFVASCSGLRLSSTTLFANCGNGNGGTVPASIDLNQVLTNRFGVLTCP
ncbi:Cyanovirin-N [Mycena rosella]|uniref:Cyanovirin-N n=1 Tax=Mycena rosella TaxID=1033263 RepID=A0AAD7C2K6_MYCRO|nr:Cyanovirin-N [Mycena rosella]